MLITRRHVRVALGGLWLLDAVLQAQPHLFTADWWHADLSQSVMGQPAPIAKSILWMVDRVAVHPALWNSAFVAVQALLGLCLLTGRFERAAIVASIPWALGIWWVGEGFGGLPTGFGLFAAGAPGPVLYYPLLGVLAWPAAGARRGSTVSVRRASCATAWAALWVGGAFMLLPWKFGPGRVLRANLEEHSLAQPAWLAGTSHKAYQFAGSHPVLSAIILGGVGVAVGLGVFRPRFTRFSLAAGVVLAIVFWVVFEDLGGIAGGDATDPGSAPLLVILALAIWPKVVDQRARRSNLAAGKVLKRAFFDRSGAVLTRGWLAGYG